MPYYTIKLCCIIKRQLTLNPYKHYIIVLEKNTKYTYLRVVYIIISKSIYCYIRQCCRSGSFFSTALGFGSLLKVKHLLPTFKRRFYKFLLPALALAPSKKARPPAPGSLGPILGFFYRQLLILSQKGPAPAPDSWKPFL